MNNRVIVAVDDMFFAARIRTTAEHLGVEVDYPRSTEAVIEAARREAPALIIVDLHAQRYDPFQIARQLKATGPPGGSAPIVGFFSHVQTDLQRRAEEAGFDRVLPRSAFTKRLPEILRGRL